MSTMLVSTFMRVAPMLPPTTSVLMRADHGVGKSQLVRQVADVIRSVPGFGEKYTFPVIDRRLSQLTEGDLMGLPSTDGAVTRFNPPDWYVRACQEPVLLFLDELNRATGEVLQGAFQIVLDHELNGHKLHPLTRVYAAINAGAVYNVNEVDPALLDRFWTIDLKPDLNDWLAWARRPACTQDPEQRRIKDLFGGLNCLPLIVDFIVDSGNDRWLDPPVNSDPGSVQVSRRSWERLGDALAFAGVVDQPNDELFYAICVGYVGAEAAIKFTEFAKANELRFTGDDLVNGYPRFRDRIMAKGSTDVLNDAIEKIAIHLGTLEKVTKKQGENLRSFMSDLPAELRISFWGKVSAGGAARIDFIKSVHPYLVKLILDVFNVPLGEAGIGVVPNIPDIFNRGATAAQAGS